MIERRPCLSLKQASYTWDKKLVLYCTHHRFKSEILIHTEYNSYGKGSNFDSKDQTGSSHRLYMTNKTLFCSVSRNCFLSRNEHWKLPQPDLDLNLTHPFTSSPPGASSLFSPLEIKFINIKTTGYRGRRPKEGNPKESLSQSLNKALDIVENADTVETLAA